MSEQSAPPWYETINVEGGRVVERLKALVHEGNVRRIVLRGPDGHVIMEVPVAVGVIGVALAPVWAAIGAVTALVAECRIEVERRDPAAPA